MTKISKRALQLIDYLDEAAQYQGWQKYQGTGTEVDKAEASWRESRQELIDYVAKLQLKLRNEKWWAQANVRIARGQI